MWGGIFLETFLSGTYSFGFSTVRNVNLLHLSQWQYWFWFFFTFFFGLYYILLMNVLTNRAFLSNPKINNSYSSHGNWGDLLVCFIPISWCFNILTNSNYLLSLVEWQSESNFYSLRIRGKQWYWVYNLSNSNSLSNYNKSLNLGNQEWSNKYHSLSFANYSNLISQIKYNDLQEYSLFGSYYQDNLIYSNSLSSSNLIFNNFYIQNYPINNFFINTHTPFTQQSWYLATFVDHLDVSCNVPLSLSINYSGFSTYQDFEINPSVTNNSNQLYMVYNDIDLNTSTQYGLNDENNPVYVILKQKSFNYNSSEILEGVRVNNVFNEDFFNSRESLNNNTLNEYFNSNRLLSTFNLLVLPTNINIGVITNSFDVIHSWFIPGLGMNLDCVPGRSTHHTLNILNPGFYYGQCAEICGRYHHHMPIRLAALQYSHFIFWWHNNGIKQLLNLNYSNNNNVI